MCAVASLITVNQVFAQSSHDSLNYADPDTMEDMSKFAISTPDGNFKLAIKGHVQQRNEWTYVPETKDKNLSISLPRARLKVLGNAFNPAITYFFQAQFESPYYDDGTGLATNEFQYNVAGSTGLRDYYLNVAPYPEYFQVRVGKFRTPFSRQQLISSSQMQFEDQSDANNQFQLTPDGHDIGVMFHNGFNNALEWALAAVSNGVVARLGYNYGGIDGYDFADFAGGGFRFALAINGFANTDYQSSDFTKDLRGGADYIVKWAGFSSNGAFYYRRYKGADQFGGGADLGYLIAKHWEPVVRYSWLKTDKDHEHQARLGINYYVFGHHLKLLTYVGPDLINDKIDKWYAGTQFQFAL